MAEDIKEENSTEATTNATTQTDNTAANTTTEPAEQESTDDGDYASPPNWVKNLTVREILALPFSDIPYTHDFFEKLLIYLYKKNWSFFQIMFVFYIHISPMFWPPFFRFVRRLTNKVTFIRWFILYLILFIYLATFVAINYFLPFKSFLPILLGIALISLGLVHLIGTHDYFKLWRQAYLNIGSMKDYLEKEKVLKRRQKEIEAHKKAALEDAALEEIKNNAEKNNTENTVEPSQKNKSV